MAEVTSSGSDVPTATMVRPISASLMPNVRAIMMAPSTTQRPPMTSPANPAMMRRIEAGMEYIFISCSSPSALLIPNE